MVTAESEDAGDGQKVIVVDDDILIRDSLRRLLRTCGYDVATFATGGAFLDAIEAGKNGCVLLDLRLRDCDGLSVLDRLVTDGYDYPIVIMTGHADVSIAAEAIRRGAADVVEKPLRFSDIVERVEVHASVNRQQRQSPPPAADALPASAPGPEPHLGVPSDRARELTPREREVFGLVVNGESTKAIAATLGISPRTVEVHRARVMEKMQARNIAHLVHLSVANRMRAY